jgi:hypothetical protein
VLHATEALHDFCVTCNASTSGGIFSEVVSFHFSVQGHAIHTQQAGCSCFVPGCLVQGLKNCVRIGIPYLIERAELDSWSTHEVRRQMIEGDDVLAAKDEGMLHGVFELPHVAGPGILEKSFQDFRPRYGALYRGRRWHRGSGADDCKGVNGRSIQEDHPEVPFVAEIRVADSWTESSLIF